MRLEKHVGKLAEVRYIPPFEEDDLSRFMAGVRKLVEEAAEPLIFCCDWRKVDLLTPTQADTIVWIMRRDNPRIGANAILAPHAKLFAQVEKIILDAANPRRRVFRTIAELGKYIDPLLNEPERVRRVAFLDAGAA